MNKYIWIGNSRGNIVLQLAQVNTIQLAQIQLTLCSLPIATQHRPPPPGPGHLQARAAHLQVPGPGASSPIPRSLAAAAQPFRRPDHTPPQAEQVGIIDGFGNLRLGGGRNRRIRRLGAQWRPEST
jgi:hypothetical protein